jgi:ABC-2 type transport system permease protein
VKHYNQQHSRLKQKRLHKKKDGYSVSKKEIQIEKLSLQDKAKNSLKRIGSLVIGSGLDWMRSPAAVFFTFIFPIIMIILMGFIFGGVVDPTYNVYYANEDVFRAADGSLETYHPADEFEEMLGFKNTTREQELGINLVKVGFNSSIHDAGDWTKAQDYPLLLVIPKGWSSLANASLLNPLAPTANVSYYYDPSYTNALTIRQIIDSVLKEMNADKFGITSLITMEISATPGRQGLEGIDFYVPGLILVTMSTAGMMGIVSTIAVQKQNGFMNRLANTLTKKWEWALATELWQIIISFMITIISVLTGWIVFGFHLSMLHPLMIPVLIFGSLTFAGMGLIIARFIKRPEAAAAGTMVIVFPMMFLSNTIMPIELFPNYLVVISQFMPLYYASEAMKAVMLPSTFGQFGYYFGILTAMGLIFFIVGSLITNFKKD